MTRVTVVQGKREAYACAKSEMDEGYDIPLCADMHFQPAVALLVADGVMHIRVNPGNFVDGRKDFEDHAYKTEEGYFLEREYLVEAMLPLVQICNDMIRCMSIGTNHSSLSSRWLSLCSDTPRGTVGSAFEFVDICRRQEFHNVVFYMKATTHWSRSNAIVCWQQKCSAWDAGITAIGIGSLLADDLGDTICELSTDDSAFEYEPCNRWAEIAMARWTSTDKQAAVLPYRNTRNINMMALI